MTDDEIHVEVLTHDLCSRIGFEVENLEAQMKMVEVAQTASEFNFDDSQLSRTRKLLDDIRTRVEVAEHPQAFGAALGEAVAE